MRNLKILRCFIETDIKTGCTGQRSRLGFKTIIMMMMMTLEEESLLVVSVHSAAPV